MAFRPQDFVVSSRSVKATHAALGGLMLCTLVFVGMQKLTDLHGEGNYLDVASSSKTNTPTIESERLSATNVPTSSSPIKSKQSSSGGQFIAPKSTSSTPGTVPQTPSASTNSGNSQAPKIPSTTHNTSPLASSGTTSVATKSMSSSISWGAYVGLDYSSNSLSDFEAKIGTPVDIQAVFVGWGNGAGDFPTEMGNPLKSSGKSLLIYWEPSVDLDAINSGVWDNYMKSFAASVRAYGAPTIMVPMHEMNGNWDIWDGPVGNNSPEKFIAAWKRMHGIFEDEGVRNVKWGWAVNSVSVPDTTENSFAIYYPGDAYVDIVGVDGFNFNEEDGWLTFSQVFDRALTSIKSYGKPIFIFSMATAAGPKKAEWITDALTVQMEKYNISGWVWFNENKEQNWLIWSDPNSLAALQTAVR
jgi:hypothetical protein